MKQGTLFIFILFCSCSENKCDIVFPFPQAEEKESLPEFKKYPAHLCRIMDELGFCEYVYSDVPDRCYEEHGYIDIHPLLPGDSTFSYFLVRLPGGSGGDYVSVYRKAGNKYLEIQKEFAFLDTVLTEQTNGLFDFIIYNRDYSRGHQKLLYQWNGKKYVPVKVIELNGFPMEMLTAMKIASPDLKGEDTFVREFDGVNSIIYFELKIDTLIEGYDESVYSVSIENWQSHKAEKCWVVKQTGDQFELVAVSGTSTATYTQDEFGKRDYKAIKR